MTATRVFLKRFSFKRLCACVTRKFRKIYRTTGVGVTAKVDRPLSKKQNPLLQWLKCLPPKSVVKNEM